MHKRSVTCTKGDSLGTQDRDECNTMESPRFNDVRDKAFSRVDIVLAVRPNMKDRCRVLGSPISASMYFLSTIALLIESLLHSSLLRSPLVHISNRCFDGEWTPRNFAN